MTNWIEISISKDGASQSISPMLGGKNGVKKLKFSFGQWSCCNFENNVETFVRHWVQVCFIINWSRCCLKFKAMKRSGDDCQKWDFRSPRIRWKI